MKSQHQNRKESTSNLLRVLSAQFESLVAARADEALLRRYAALLRFLKSKKSTDVDHLFEESVRSAGSFVPAIKAFTEDQIVKFSLDDLERLVNDERTTRKELEFIAIHRFKVPRGSMRSLSNRRMLVDELRVSIRNERAHDTINVVAREHGQRFSDDSE